MVGGRIIELMRCGVLSLGSGLGEVVGVYKGCVKRM